MGGGGIGGGVQGGANGGAAAEGGSPGRGGGSGTSEQLGPRTRGVAPPCGSHLHAHSDCFLRFCGIFMASLRTVKINRSSSVFWGTTGEQSNKTGGKWEENSHAFQPMLP